MIRRQFLALLAVPAVGLAQAADEPSPEAATAWLAVIHCAPTSGAVQVTVSEGVQAQATPGQMLGPVGLKPGTLQLQVRVGEKTITGPVELKENARSLALLVPDEKQGLAVKSIPLPAAGGKRLALRLPGTGNKTWKAGKKKLPIGEAVEFSGRPMIKDDTDKDVVQVDGEESGIYLLAPAADEGEVRVIYLP